MSGMVEGDERKRLTDLIAPERVTWNADGTLDEVCARGGAHLEHMGGSNWYLSIEMEDGRDFVVWFRSKDLRKPHHEWRDPASPISLERLREIAALALPIPGGENTEGEKR